MGIKYETKDLRELLRKTEFELTVKIESKYYKILNIEERGIWEDDKSCCINCMYASYEENYIMENCKVEKHLNAVIENENIQLFNGSICSLIQKFKYQEITDKKEVLKLSILKMPNLIFITKNKKDKFNFRKELIKRNLER